MLFLCFHALNYSEEYILVTFASFRLLIVWLKENFENFKLMKKYAFYN